ncbi:MAG TPA: hypothetical protein VHF22_15525 [Planctomycetota bacterium]|nr:hypothetical protein [Planctomycetota bacterium]
MLAFATGCCFLGDNEMPPQPVYAPIWQPKLALHEKAERYERAFKAHNRTPEGLVDYEPPKKGRGPGEPRYGNYSDGPFHTGISLATFSFKYAATHDRAVLADVSKALEGLEMLEKVTGKPGLLARYFSKDPPPFDPDRFDHGNGFRAAPPCQDYVWRNDVSKDQYSGVSFGLGACLAHVDDPTIRARAAGLARRIATALERDGERIIDASGKETRFGDLRVSYGPVKIALHAAILLGLAKEAAADGHGDAYYRDLLDRGCADAVAEGWFNVSIFTVRNHVNDNMAFLVLYPLIALEPDPDLRDRYQQGLEGEWADVADELTPFFDLAYAASGGRRREKALSGAVASMKLFPDEKHALPVDWTRPQFESLDLGRRFFNSRQGRPRADRPLPLNMRPVGDMLWVQDPDILCGNEGERDERWVSPLDYLEAYWLGRAHGLIGAGD